MLSMCFLCFYTSSLFLRSSNVTAAGWEYLAKPVWYSSRSPKTQSFPSLIKRNFFSQKCPWPHREIKNQLLFLSFDRFRSGIFQLVSTVFGPKTVSNTHKNIENSVYKQAKWRFNSKGERVLEMSEKFKRGQVLRLELAWSRLSNQSDKLTVVHTSFLARTCTIDRAEREILYHNFPSFDNKIRLFLHKHAT